MAMLAAGGGRRAGWDSRVVRLTVIAAGLATVGLGLWGLGHLFGSPLLRYGGLMTMATTFVPLPADTFTLQAAASAPAAAVALVGGTINAVVVVIERSWVLLLVDHPFFARVRRFFDTNRYVAWADRSMFLTLILGGFLFFDPFKLLAVMRRYPARRYAAAVFVSRTARYYLLALLGAAAFDVGILGPVVAVSLSLFAVGLARTVIKVQRERRMEGAGAGAGAGAGEAVPPV